MVATLHSAGMLVDQQMLQSIGSQRSKRQHSNWQHSWLFRWVHSMVLTDNKIFGGHFSLAHQSHNDFQGESGTTFPSYLRSSPWLNTQDLLCIWLSQFIFLTRREAPTDPATAAAGLAADPAAAAAAAAAGTAPPGALPGMPGQDPQAFGALTVGGGRLCSWEFLGSLCRFRFV